MSSSIVTIEEIIEQCISSPLESSAAVSRLTYMIAPKDYYSCWDMFSRWIKDQMDLGNSVSFLNVAIIGFRTFNLGIRIPTFELSEAFKTRFGVVQETSISAPHRRPHVVYSGLTRFHPDILTEELGLNREKVLFALQNIFDRIGLYAGMCIAEDGAIIPMGERAKKKSGHFLLNVDFGIGILQCHQRVVRFEFRQQTDHQSGLPPTPRPASVAGSYDPPLQPTRPSSHPSSRSSNRRSSGTGIPGRYFISQGSRMSYSNNNSQADSGPLAALRRERVQSEPASARRPPSGRKERVHLDSPSRRPSEATEITRDHVHSDMARSFSPAFRFSRRNMDNLLLPKIEPSSEDPKKKLELNVSQVPEFFPPLVDNNSRLKAAIKNDHKYQESICNKIGSHFSPRASNLYLNQEKGTIAWRKAPQQIDSENPLSEKNPFHSQASLATTTRNYEKFRLKEASFPATSCPTQQFLLGIHLCGMTVEVLQTSQQRYLHYLKVDGGQFAAGMGSPFDAGSHTVGPQSNLTWPTDWENDDNDSFTSIQQMDKTSMDHVLQKVFIKPEQTVDVESSVLNALLDELNRGYYYSIRKSILDYILLSEKERERLQIYSIPPEFAPEAWGWGCGKEVKQTPPWWHSNVLHAHTFLEGRCLMATASMKASLRLILSATQSEISLVNLPFSEDGILSKGYTPLRPHEFLMQQNSHLNKVRKDINEACFPALSNIFMEAITGEGLGVGDDLMQRYLTAINLILATNLRSLVLRSMHQVLNFFKAFINRKSNLSCALMIELVDEKPGEGEEYSYEKGIFMHITSKKLRGQIEDWIVEITDAFSRVKRVSASINMDLNPSQPLQIIDEEARQEADKIRTEVLRILDESYSSALMGQARYVSYLFLLTESPVDSEERNTPMSFQTPTMRQSVFATPTGSIAGAAFNREIAVARLEHDTDSEQGPPEGSLEYYQNFFDKHLACIKEITRTPPYFRSEEHMLISLDATKLHGVIVQRAKDASQKLAEKIIHKAIDEADQVSKDARIAVAHLSKKPLKAEELIKSERFLQKMSSKGVRKLKDDSAKISKQVDLLFEYNYLSKEVLESLVSMAASTKKLQSQIPESKSMLKRERASMEQQLRSRKEEFIAQIKACDQQTFNLKYTANIKQVREMVELTSELKKDVEAFKQAGLKINHEEDTLGLPRSDFIELGEVWGHLRPFHELWHTIANFQKSYSQWTRATVTSWDGKKVEAEHKEMTLTLRNAMRDLQNMNDVDDPIKVGKQVLDQLERFEKNIPVVRALGNENLKQKHWEQISSVLGFTLSPDSPTSFNQLSELGLLTEGRSARLVTISENADRECQTEKTLGEIEKFLQEASLQLTKDAKTGDQGLTEAELELKNNLTLEYQEKIFEIKRHPIVKENPQYMHAVDEKSSNLEKVLHMLTACMKAFQGMQRLAKLLGFGRHIALLQEQPSKKIQRCYQKWHRILVQINENPNLLHNSNDYRINSLNDLLEDIKYINSESDVI